MRFKLIGCEVFTREICHCVARSPHVVDVEFTEKGSHDEPDSLREIIQSRIDAIEESGREYDAILLCYGICGNSTVGLVSRNVQLVIPRAHDCCALFLGSKEKFKEHFADNPSTPFSSVGYMEKGGSSVREASDVRKLMGLDRSYESLVESHGEDNAKYIWRTLHPARGEYGESDFIVFVNVQETAQPGYAEKCEAEARADGKRFVRLEGSIRFIRNLISGEWNEDDFLVVEQGQRIAGVYDWDVVLKAADVAE